MTVSESSDPTDFQQLIGRVRQGDAEAAEQLVRSCESELRIMARVRLTDPKLRREIDSMDICQSILGNFFVRAASGQFELDSNEQLLRLLSRMVRNKVIDHGRRIRRDRRDVRRQVSTSADEIPLADGARNPDSIVANRELLGRTMDLLSDDDRKIVEQRTAGCDWSEIAEQMNSTADAVRKRFSRALDRAVEHLGMDKLNDD
jgi:RNA polymerase sigma factor (sigma-70 family)